MRERVPDRLVRAVELLDVRLRERILEVGCGPGVAAALLCDRVGDGGRVTAIDRSATAIERARKRNADAVATGRLTLQHVALAQLPAESAHRFDAVLAVNVNVFWAGNSDEEFQALARVTKPGARLVIAYETPTGTLSAEARRTIIATLRDHGFTSKVLREPPLVAFVATRGSAGRRRVGGQP